MTTAQPDVLRADAESVVEKLQSLREALSPSEQHALDTILRVFEARVTEPSAQELLADFPDGPELLDDVAGFKTPEGQEPQAAPVTVVTITTVWASHPWVGC
jgi:hypothetical protein